MIDASSTQYKHLQFFDEDVSSISRQIGEHEFLPASEHHLHPVTRHRPSRQLCFRRFQSRQWPPEEPHGLSCHLRNARMLIYYLPW